MKLTSPDFNNGESLPDKHAFDFDNLSPTLTWTGIPDGTKELALICDDPDAPMGTWVHWVIYGLPTSIDVKQLSRGVPKGPSLENPPGAKQGKNGFGNTGYDGPRPPRGPVHRYFFHLFALREPVNLAPGATAAQLRKAMEGKILAQAEIVGTYSR
jgi:hypothetical protein